jgi:hypothetical protein
MTQPIRIHSVDKTDAEVRARHEAVEKRLDELGVEGVKILMRQGGLPNEWNCIIMAWMAGDKLEAVKDSLTTENAKTDQN